MAKSLRVVEGGDSDDFIYKNGSSNATKRKEI